MIKISVYTLSAFSDELENISKEAGAASKLIRRWSKAAKKAGWEIGRTTKGHLRFKSPDKSVPIIIGSGTPRSPRAFKELQKMLNRHGLAVQGLG